MNAYLQSFLIIQEQIDAGVIPNDVKMDFTLKRGQNKAL